MANYIRFKMSINFSKFLAFLIVIVGSVATFVLKDMAGITVAAVAALGIVAGRDFQDRKGGVR